MSERNAAPLVTFGMPVYNGEAWIKAALDSLLGQTYRDFVLLISDNASTDRTGEICREYASRDSRVHYVRQETNLGAGANFKFVLLEAKSEFFMWAAADDTRSPDFLEANLAFLIEHPDYLGSTSRVRFCGRSLNEISMGDAPLSEEDRYERIIKFLSSSHHNGRFYSLFRRDAVVAWPQLNDANFLGSDWSLVIHMAAKGKLNRLSEGWVELGLGGESNTKDFYARYRRGWADWIFPFRRLSRDTLMLMSGASYSQKFRLLWKLIRRNLDAFLLQFIFMLRRRKAGVSYHERR